MKDRFDLQALFIETLDIQAGLVDSFCLFDIFRQVMLVVRSQLSLEARVDDLNALSVCSLEPT